MTKYLKRLTKLESGIFIRGKYYKTWINSKGEYCVSGELLEGYSKMCSYNKKYVEGGEGCWELIETIEIAGKEYVPVLGNCYYCDLPKELCSTKCHVESNKCLKLFEGNNKINPKVITLHVNDIPEGFNIGYKIHVSNNCFKAALLYDHCDFIIRNINRAKHFIEIELSEENEYNIVDKIISLCGGVYKGLVLDEKDPCPKCIKGIMEYEYKGEECTCHLGHPPCSYCTSSYLVCSECGFNQEEEEQTKERTYQMVKKYEYVEAIEDIIDQKGLMVITRGCRYKLLEDCSPMYIVIDDLGRNANITKSAFIGVEKMPTVDDINDPLLKQILNNKGVTTMKEATKKAIQKAATPLKHYAMLRTIELVAASIFPGLNTQKLERVIRVVSKKGFGVIIDATMKVGDVVIGNLVSGVNAVMDAVDEEGDN